MMSPRKFNLNQRGLMYNRISMMLENSIPVSEVFEALAEEFTYLSDALRRCAKKARDGVSLTKALDDEKLLTKSELATLASAEQSGNLPESLAGLAFYCETVESQTSKARQKILPNIGYVVAAIAVLYGMLLYLVPSIGSNISDDKKADFFIFTASDAVVSFHSQYAVFALVGMISIAVLSFKYLSSPEGKQMLRNFAITLPILGDGMSRFFLGLWAKQVALMIRSGVSFTAAVDMTKDMLPEVLAKDLVRTVRDVERVGWQQALIKKNWEPGDNRFKWPTEVFGALRSGGDTGRLDRTLELLSKGLIEMSDKIITKFTGKAALFSFLFAALTVALVVGSVMMATMAGIQR